MRIDWQSWIYLISIQFSSQVVYITVQFIQSHHCLKWEKTRLIYEKRGKTSKILWLIEIHKYKWSLIVENRLKSTWHVPSAQKMWPTTHEIILWKNPNKKLNVNKKNCLSFLSFSCRGRCIPFPFLSFVVLCSLLFCNAFTNADYDLLESLKILAETFLFMSNSEQNEKKVPKIYCLRKTKRHTKVHRWTFMGDKQQLLLNEFLK